MSKIEIRPVVLAPLLAFVASILLALFAGLFLGLFGSFFVQDTETTILFEIAFVTVFVLPAYVFCGIAASFLARTRPLVHATIAGFVYLIANLAMSFPSDPEDPFGLSDALCFISIVPLAMLGAKIGESIR
ncbi:MAG: hypothetical protein ACK5YR_09095 [Pirellula sp.]|jgi:putative membrane protein (TIGR04086 family)